MLTTKQLAVAMPLLLCVSAAVAHDVCKQQAMEVPVTMDGMRPLVTAKINGIDAQFVADSGSSWSVISPATQAAAMWVPGRPGFLARMFCGCWATSNTTLHMECCV